MSNCPKIAILEASVQLPGVNTTSELLELIFEKREALREVEIAEHEDGSWVRRRPLLDNYDKFDPEYFGLSQRDAILIDPQHRLFLMACRSLLYQAGINAKTARSIGVFASCDENQYERSILSALSSSEIQPYERFIASDKDFLATRVAHALDLTGPAVSIQTACSSSLVAIYTAVQSLLTGDCEMCIAGGVALQIPHGAPYKYVKDMIYSPDGRCRPFDEKAGGTNLGSGVAVVLLKRLSDAERDNDRIMAVISGGGINNDGRRKMSFTAPSAAGQKEAITTALTRSEVDPDQLRFVEVHGTATKLGDPIEFSALNKALGGLTSRVNFCALTGVKANIGHLSNAAGAAGLIKAAACLEAGMVPPMTNFESPSQLIRLEGTPFTILKEPQPMPPGRSAALVSSFGIGGTNVCLVLERHDPQNAKSDDEMDYLVPITDDKLGNIEPNLGTITSELSVAPQKAADISRTAFRLGSAGTFRGGLVTYQGKVVAKATPVKPETIPSRLCFVLPGQGTQRHGALRGLYDRNPTFCQTFDRVAGLFAPHIPNSIADVVWSDRQDLNALLDDALYVQPILFCQQYALVATLSSIGIEPVMLVGHSFGEITALALAGVLSLQDAVDLVVTRARAMAAAPPGAMLAVGGPNADFARREAETHAGVYLAAINGPNQMVFAGETAAIDAFEQSQTKQGRSLTRLRTSRPFHTPMIRPALDELVRVAKDIQIQRAKTPIVSTATGKELILSDSSMLASHIAHHATGPVLFHNALLEAVTKGATIFVEIGDTFMSHPVLATGSRAMPLLERCDGDEYSGFLSTVLKLWSWGAVESIEQFRPRGRPRSGLPNYAFSLRTVWPKVEKAALNSTDKNEMEPTTSVVVDVTQIVELFRHLLMNDNITEDSDFFELGGHSLLAITFCQMLSTRTNKALSVARFFELRTPRRVAEE